MFTFHRLKDRQKTIFLTVFTLLLTSIDISSREINPKSSFKEKTFYNNIYSTSNDPILEYAVHNRGRIQLAIGNNGTFGTLGSPIIDPITGIQVQSCIYPKNSDILYLWVAALWIGAVVGRDTLVSTANEDFYRTLEFWPDVKPFGDFKYKSIDENSAFFSEDAYSEEDILCEYTDTLTNHGLVDSDPADHRPHKPLNIKVTQRSMAWSYSYADDFILFDYKIENIGDQILKDVYMGIYVDGDVWHTSRNGPEGWNDDIVGFYRYHEVPEGGGFIDTINIAFTADNDGDPENGKWNEKSALGVVGAMVVRTPSDSLRYSYNWWIINYGDPSRDFGPRRIGTPDDPYRNFGSRMGTPIGDKNKYYILKHEEFDYDLLYTAIDHSQDGWLPPPEEAEEFAIGFDTRYLLSFGPFEINPGEKLPISFAWVGGENLHVNPEDFDYHDPYNPDLFYKKLDFSSLAANSRWASWIYDNPGIDTDGDGYFGKYRIICYDTTITDSGIIYSLCDTTYYEGDGVPDFRGASPPPAPKFWIEPGIGSLQIRFNGIRSETTEDIFSHVLDFEGYRIYIARDDRSSSYTLVASYDKEDYNKLVWNDLRIPTAGYELLDNPFTLNELRCLYGDSCNDLSFNPLNYTRSSPFLHPSFPDSVFYFESQDYNTSELGIDTPIRKIFPNQSYPSHLNPDSARPDELTEDGYLKYFEYELTIENLLPTVQYWINVTAFDFGSPEVGLTSLETPVDNGAKVAYPLTSVDEVEEKQLKAYVYPNPYRVDEKYDETGFENRDGTLAVDRARRIHFANLPRVCKIYIYSIDGDLIREINHNYPGGGPEAMHETWDLITRNTQAIVSGLYYFVIESKYGTQLGKFVIIM